ncbi:MAG: hypothetical protein NC131_20380, partial [Roseburia sp.]|nr:hypothetical protein [Roseburia sp.]
MKVKFGVKQIVLLCVAVVLAGVIIAGNIVLNHYSPIIHSFFAGDTTDYDNERAQAALADGNLAAQQIAEDSMVLLKNENNALPIAENAKINLFGWNATDDGFILTGGGSGGSTIAAENKVTLTQALK